MGAAEEPYARGALRLAVARRAVPALGDAVRDALSAAFSSLEEHVLPCNDAADLLPSRVGRELLCWGRRCEIAVDIPAPWLLPAPPTVARGGWDADDDGGGGGGGRGRGGAAAFAAACCAQF